MDTKLWYTSPALTFNEALPVGNGSLGGMVYGTLPKEHIILNLDTLWSGTKQEDNKMIPKEQLDYVREMIFKGEYKIAETMIQKHMLGHYNESYMPLAMLDYSFDGIKEFSDYKRSLDLEKAQHILSFHGDGKRYESELFISYVDDVLVNRITSDTKNSINLTVFLSSKIQHISSVGKEDSMIIQGNAPTHVAPNYVKDSHAIVFEHDNPGMPFCGYVKVKTEDGIVCIKDGNICIKNASAVELYFVAADGYEGYQNEVNQSPAKCYNKCFTKLDNLGKYTYFQLKERHIKDYQAVYKNVTLSLGQEHINLPTNERLKNIKEGKEDKGMYCLYFHYNRYLLITSSRKGSQPANLQGIWSDDMRPVWSSNWTININTQMNYWFAGMCNLTESYEPLIQMLEELSIAGQRTAKNYYHCRGWAANHNIDLWRQTTPVGGQTKYAYWPMGGVWLSSQIYDYYKYTLDKEYLRDHIYPVMKGSALFLLDWMVKGEDGFYHTVPSNSPENTFVDKNGEECSISYSSTLDLGLIRELFNHIIEASNILQIEDDIVTAIKKRVTQLPPYQISGKGRLLEWAQDFKEYDPGHRHFSPLFAFHPGTSINKYDTPDLVKACEQFIDRRLKYGGGHIGWSCAWLINLYARLGNGDEAFHYLKQLLKYSSYDNLFDLHPPLLEGTGEREVFQIDGNFGSGSGMANMLLQSQLNEIELLPALPKDWKKGSIKGLLAQGAITVSIHWEDGKLKEAKLSSRYSQYVIVQYILPIKVMLGNNVCLNLTQDRNGGQGFYLSEGEIYVVRLK